MVSVLPYLFLLLLLVLPSSNLQEFNGLPLSRWAEFLALVLIVPFLFSRQLRQRAEGLFQKVRIPPLVFYVLGAAVFALKAGLLIWGVKDGFIGCYSSPAGWAATYSGDGPKGECERSYEDLFHQSEATRMDRTIAFDPDSWDLIFLNSRRYDFYEKVAGAIPRDRIPIDARWRGKVELETPSRIVVEYIGEGNLAVGADAVALPPSYDQAGKVALDLPAGPHDVSLQYGFNDNSRTGQAGESGGPRAQIRLTLVDDTGEHLLRAASPGWIWAVLAAAADLLLVILLSIPLLAFLTEAWKDKRVVLSLTLLLALLFFLPLSQRVRGLGMTSALMGFWLWHLFRRPAQFVSVYTALFGAGLAITLLFLPSPDRVVLRSAWDDPLTLESYAYDILSTGSLEAGEKVFFAQPMYRYIKFSEHALMGDGGTLYGTAQLALFFGGAFFLFDSVRRKGIASGKRWLLAAAGTAVFFLGGYYVSIVIRTGISEYPTWSLLLWILPLLFFRDSPATRIFCLAALAFSFTIRMNQAVAILFLMLPAFLGLWNRSKKAFVGGAVVAGFILLLPLFHNLYYGHEFVLTTSSMAVPQNLPLPPAVWIAFLQGDADAAGAVFGHLKTLFLFADVTLSTRLILAAMAACFAVWFPVFLFALIRRRSASECLLLAIPLFYLAPHLFFDVHIYYPRLFFIGYLSMAAVAAVWLAGGQWRQTEKISGDLPR